MAKSKAKSKSTQLISGKARESFQSVISNPWRSAVVAIGLVVITFAGVRIYQYSEAATLEDQAKQDCGAYGIKASIDTAKCIARNVLIPYRGWSISQQMPQLVSLWNAESGWRWNAYNISGAYGIPQSLPGSKMGSENCVHETWQTNATCQMHWGVDYIAGTYGTPTQAWTFWNCTGTCYRKAGTVYGKTGHWY